MTRLTGVRVGNDQYRCRWCKCMISLQIIIILALPRRVTSLLVPFVRPSVVVYGVTWFAFPNGLARVLVLVNIAADGVNT